MSRNGTEASEAHFAKPESYDLYSVELFDLRELLVLLKRRAKFIFAFAFAGSMIALSLSFAITPRYKAESVVMIDSRESSLTGMEAVVSNLSPESAAIRSEIDIINSRAVLDRVVKRLNLTEHSDFNSSLRPPGQIEEFIKSFFPEIPTTEKSAKEKDEITLIRDATKVLQENLEVVNTPRSYIIRISYTSENPEFAAKIANTIADEYLVDQLEAKYEMARRANEWLSKQLDDLREEVKVKEKAAEDFKIENNLTRVGEETITQKQLIEINSKLVTARSDRSQAEARLKSVQELVGNKKGIESIADVLSSDLIQRLNEQEATVRRKIAELSNRYGPRHPNMINAQAELKDIREKLDEEAQKIVAGLKNSVNVARARVQSLEKELARLEDQAGIGNQSMITLRQLEREAAASRSLLESFLDRYKQITQQENMQIPDARIIAKAYTPKEKYFPSNKIFCAVGFAISMFLGTALVLLLEYLDRGIRNNNQLTELFGYEGFGMIPLIEKNKKLTPVRYASEKPLSSYGESLRSIRTAIHYSNIDNPAKTLTVLSSVPGEGKSNLSASLACVLARAGSKILLIDCDLRRSQVHSIFGQDENKGDLITFLTGKHSLDEVLHTDKETGLNYITAKSHTPSPQELLSSRNMDNLLKKVREEYDLVIIDTPPLMAVSDGAVLARKTDACVYIVQWNNTPREVVRQGLKKLENVKIKPTGMVLTQVDMKEQSKYGYGDYGYYYSRYGDYYGEG